MNNNIEYAFPQPAEWDIGGMTLRDYFAAKAMQGYVTRGAGTRQDTIAKWSYEVADSMLKERDKQ